MEQLTFTDLSNQLLLSQLSSQAIVVDMQNICALSISAVEQVNRLKDEYQLHFRNIRNHQVEEYLLLAGIPLCQQSEQLTLWGNE